MGVVFRRVLNRRRSQLSSLIAANESLYEDASETKNFVHYYRMECVGILQRAGRSKVRAGNCELGEELFGIAEKLAWCRKNKRCNSLACPMCREAHQRAKSFGQTQLLSKLTEQGLGQAVMGTLVPLNLRFSADKIAEVCLRTMVRRFKDNLARHGFTEALVGHADISWEPEHYFQLHFHIGLVTTDSAGLTASLKHAFPRDRPRSRPVHFRKARNLAFLPYINKTVRTADLLRNARRQLPALLTMLDRNDPMDGLVLRDIRLSTENGKLVFKPIKSDSENRIEKSCRLLH